jgi:hypothetical protein
MAAHFVNMLKTIDGRQENEGIVTEKIFYSHGENIY